MKTKKVIPPSKTIIVKTEDQDRKELESVAYHEAGHVAMALYQGLKFQYVSIEETEERMGHVKMYKFRFSRQWPLRNSMKEKVYKWQLMVLAGHAAERCFCGSEEWTVSQTDIENFSSLSNIMFLACDDMRLDGKKSKEEINDRDNLWFDFEYALRKEETENIIAFMPVWKFICKLVTVLKRKKKMVYNECLELYNKTAKKQIDLLKSNLN